MPKTINQLFACLATLIMGSILCLGVGYLGYRFVQDVGEKTVSIEENANHDQPNEDVLISSIPVFSDGMIDGVSAGEDMVITAGEFAYRYGQPEVKLLVHNQAQFNVSRFVVRLSLYLNNDVNPIAPAILLPATLSEPLGYDQNTVVNWTINDARWRTVTVEEAQERKVVVQLISVTDDMTKVDYPQVGKAIGLRQVANDWRIKPNSAKNNVESLLDLNEQNLSSNNINVQSNPLVQQGNNQTDGSHILSIEINEY